MEPRPMRERQLMRRSNTGNNGGDRMGRILRRIALVVTVPSTSNAPVEAPDRPGLAGGHGLLGSPYRSAACCDGRGNAERMSMLQQGHAREKVLFEYYYMFLRGYLV